MYYYVKEIASRNGKICGKEDIKIRKFKTYARAQIAFNKSANALREMMDKALANGADFTKDDNIVSLLMYYSNRSYRRIGVILYQK